MNGSNIRRALLCATFGLALPPVAWSQTPATTNQADTRSEEVVTLPQFTITETAANPYVSRQALSASRVAMDIQDIPQSVSVVTKDFIKDSMGQRMLDAAKYITPVVESTRTIPTLISCTAARFGGVTPGSTEYTM